MTVRLTDRQMEHIKARYKEVAAPVIATELGISPQTVCRRLKAMGIPLHGSGKRPTYPTRNGVKRCAKCLLPKPIGEFKPNDRGYKGHNPYCASCKRDIEYRQELRRNYGLTTEEYKAMLHKQQGCCAICHKPDPERRLSVDHDHTTGKVRGLLCCACNRAIGSLNDDPALCLAASEYLKEHVDA